ncbi:MAG: recombinase RecA [Euryarchaeota archaeon]|nr:recombinase RecA [Euryarchaeota archaeon]MBU4138933.1 recombinase RecA [Euryarchaeota archaeon]
MGDYTLGIKELDNEIKGLRKGSNILMIGPPMSQKEVILYNIMYHGAAVNKNAVVIVTTHESGTQILDWLKENKSVFPLSRIGQFFEEFLMRNDFKSIQLHINSLSTMLMYSNINTVFKFIHVFTGRIKAAGALGIFVMESGMHDGQAIATLKQLFDGVIEIKTENDVNYIRIFGLSPKPTPWFEYEIEGGNLRIVS